MGSCCCSLLSGWFGRNQIADIPASNTVKSVAVAKVTSTKAKAMKTKRSTVIRGGGGAGLGGAGRRSKVTGKKSSKMASTKAPSSKPTPAGGASPAPTVTIIVTPPTPERQVDGGQQRSAIGSKVTPSYSKRHPALGAIGSSRLTSRLQKGSDPRPRPLSSSSEKKRKSTKSKFRSAVSSKLPSTSGLSASALSRATTKTKSPLGSREEFTMNLLQAASSSSSAVFGLSGHPGGCSVLSAVSKSTINTSSAPPPVVFLAPSERPTLPVDFTASFLASEQSRSETPNIGRPINSTIVSSPSRMFGVRDLASMRANPSMPPDTKLIIFPPFSNLDLIVPGLYLTGICGQTREALAQAKITLIINATFEWALLKVPGSLTSYRVPVEDAAEEPIGRYFDDVADLIESTRRAGGNSLVHCMAGVSRSATLVLAYLLKYTNLSLRRAFVHVHTLRPVIRPNHGFWQQLIEYEVRVRGRASTALVMVSHPGVTAGPGVAVVVPDFYSADFPKLLEMELNKEAAKSGGTVGRGKGALLEREFK